MAEIAATYSRGQEASLCNSEGSCWVALGVELDQLLGVQVRGWSMQHGCSQTSDLPGIQRLQGSHYVELVLKNHALHRLLAPQEHWDCILGRILVDGYLNWLAVDWLCDLWLVLLVVIYLGW